MKSTGDSHVDKAVSPLVGLCLLSSIITITSIIGYVFVAGAFSFVDPSDIDTHLMIIAAGGLLLMGITGSITVFSSLYERYASENNPH